MMTNFMSYGMAPAASAAGGQEDRVQETLNEFREEMRAGIQALLTKKNPTVFN